MTKKILSWAILIGLLSLVPLAVLPSANLPAVLKFPALSVNLVQRVLGLTIFVLMFWQIWTERLDSWVFIYTLVVLNLLFFGLANYFAGHGLDPFYVFTDVCVLCSNRFELLYTLGRLVFWLLTISVFAGLFKVKGKFSALNYAAFLLIGIQGFFLWIDFRTPPFFYFAVVAYLLVLYTIARKIPGIIADLKSWLKG